MSMVSISSQLSVAQVTAPVSLSQNPMLAIAQADTRVQAAANNVSQVYARYQNEIDEIMKKKAAEIAKLEQSVASLQKQIAAQNVSYDANVQSQNAQISNNASLINVYQQEKATLENQIQAHLVEQSTLTSHNQSLNATVANWRSVLAQLS